MDCGAQVLRMGLYGLNVLVVARTLLNAPRNLFSSKFLEIECLEEQ